MGYLGSYALTYVLPFLAYFLGIVVRYYARFLHDTDPPPLQEQLVAGCVFSFVAVAPFSSRFAWQYPPMAGLT